MPTETCWRLLKHETARDQSDKGNVDTCILSLGANKNVYVVTVAGMEGMSVQEVADALRAALVHYVRAATGNVPEGFGCRTAQPGETVPEAGAKVN